LNGLLSWPIDEVMLTKSPSMKGACCLESQSTPNAPPMRPFRQDGMSVAPASGAAPGMTGGRSTLSMMNRVIGRLVTGSIGRFVIGQTASTAGGATRGMHIG